MPRLPGSRRQRRVQRQHNVQGQRNIQRQPNQLALAESRPQHANASMFQHPSPPVIPTSRPNEAYRSLSQQPQPPVIPQLIPNRSSFPQPQQSVVPELRPNEAHRSSFQQPKQSVVRELRPNEANRSSLQQPQSSTVRISRRRRADRVTFQKVTAPKGGIPHCPMEGCPKRIYPKSGNRHFTVEHTVKTKGYQCHCGYKASSAHSVLFKHHLQNEHGADRTPDLEGYIVDVPEGYIEIMHCGMCPMSKQHTAFSEIRLKKHHVERHNVVEKHPWERKQVANNQTDPQCPIVDCGMRVSRLNLQRHITGVHVTKKTGLKCECGYIASLVDKLVFEKHLIKEHGHPKTVGEDLEPYKIEVPNGYTRLVVCKRCPIVHREFNVEMMLKHGVDVHKDAEKSDVEESAAQPQNNWIYCDEEVDSPDTETDDNGEVPCKKRKLSSDKKDTKEKDPESDCKIQKLMSNVDAKDNEVGIKTKSDAVSSKSHATVKDARDTEKESSKNDGVTSKESQRSRRRKRWEPTSSQDNQSDSVSLVCPVDGCFKAGQLKDMRLHIEQCHTVKMTGFQCYCGFKASSVDFDLFISHLRTCSCHDKSDDDIEVYRVDVPEGYTVLVPCKRCPASVNHMEFSDVTLNKHYTECHNMFLKEDRKLFPGQKGRTLAMSSYPLCPVVGCGKPIHPLQLQRHVSKLHVTKKTALKCASCGFLASILDKRQFTNHLVKHHGLIGRKDFKYEPYTIDVPEGYTEIVLCKHCPEPHQEFTLEGMVRHYAGTHRDVANFDIQSLMPLSFNKQSLEDVYESLEENYDNLQHTGDATSEQRSLEGRSKYPTAVLESTSKVVKLTTKGSGTINPSATNSKDNIKVEPKSPVATSTITSDSKAAGTNDPAASICEESIKVEPKSPTATTESTSGNVTLSSKAAGTNDPSTSEESIKCESKSLTETSESIPKAADTNMAPATSADKSSDKDSLFPCSHADCEYSGASKKDLKMHVKRMHDVKTWGYRCTDCGYSATQYDVMEMLSHRSRAHGGTMQDDVLLFRHTTRHSFTRLHECEFPDCDFRGFSKNSVHKHGKKMHTVQDAAGIALREKAQLQCPHKGCGQYRQKRAQMRYHLHHDHGRKMWGFKCNDCDFYLEASEIAALRKHRATVHKERKKVDRNLYRVEIPDGYVTMETCKLCSYRAFTREQVQLHFLSKHADEVAASAGSNEWPSSDDPTYPLNDAGSLLGPAQINQQALQQNYSQGPAQINQQALQQNYSQGPAQINQQTMQPNYSQGPAQMNQQTMQPNYNQGHGSSNQQTMQPSFNQVPSQMIQQTVQQDYNQGSTLMNQQTLQPNYNQVPAQMSQQTVQPNYTQGPTQMNQQTVQTNYSPGPAQMSQQTVQPNYNQGTVQQNYAQGSVQSYQQAVVQPNYIQGSVQSNNNQQTVRTSYDQGTLQQNYNQATYSQGTAQQNLNPGTLQQNLNPGTLQQNLNPGTLQQNLNPGTLHQNLNPGTQQQNFNPGTQQQNLNPGTLQQNLNPGNLQQNLNPGTLQQNLNPGTLQQNLNPGNLQQNLNPGTLQQNLNPGTLQQNLNPGTLQQNLNPGTLQQNLNPGTVQPNFNQMNVQTNYNQGSTNVYSTQINLTLPVIHSQVNTQVIQSESNVQIVNPSYSAARGRSGAESSAAPVEPARQGLTGLMLLQKMSQSLRDVKK